MEKVAQDVLNTEMQKIYNRDGCITVTAGINEATPEDAPLHHGLTWDDKKGGEINRGNEMRAMIRRCRIVAHGELQGVTNVPPEKIEAKAVSLEGAYFPPSQIAKVPDMAVRAFNQLKNQINGLYKHIDELMRHLLPGQDIAPLEGAIDELARVFDEMKKD